MRVTNVYSILDLNNIQNSNIKQDLNRENFKSFLNKITDLIFSYKFKFNGFLYTVEKETNSKFNFKYVVYLVQLDNETRDHVFNDVFKYLYNNKESVYKISSQILIKKTEDALSNSEESIELVTNENEKIIINNTDIGRQQNNQLLKSQSKNTLIVYFDDFHVLFTIKRVVDVLNNPNKLKELKDKNVKILQSASRSEEILESRFQFVLNQIFEFFNHNNYFYLAKDDQNTIRIENFESFLKFLNAIQTNSNYYFDKVKYIKHDFNMILTDIKQIASYLFDYLGSETKTSNYELDLNILKNSIASTSFLEMIMEFLLQINAQISIYNYIERNYGKLDTYYISGEKIQQVFTSNKSKINLDEILHSIYNYFTFKDKQSLEVLEKIFYDIRGHLLQQDQIFEKMPLDQLLFFIFSSTYNLRITSADLFIIKVPSESENVENILNNIINFSEDKDGKIKLQFNYNKRNTNLIQISYKKIISNQRFGRANLKAHVDIDFLQKFKHLLNLNSPVILDIDYKKLFSEILKSITHTNQSTVQTFVTKTLTRVENINLDKLFESINVTDKTTVYDLITQVYNYITLNSNEFKNLFKLIHETNDKILLTTIFEFIEDVYAEQFNDTEYSIFSKQIAEIINSLKKGNISFDISNKQILNLNKQFLQVLNTILTYIVAIKIQSIFISTKFLKERLTHTTNVDTEKLFEILQNSKNKKQKFIHLKRLLNNLSKQIEESIIKTIDNTTSDFSQFKKFEKVLQSYLDNEINRLIITEFGTISNTIDIFEEMIIFLTNCLYTVIYSFILLQTVDESIYIIQNILSQQLKVQTNVLKETNQNKVFLLKFYLDIILTTDLFQMKNKQELTSFVTAIDKIKCSTQTQEINREITFEYESEEFNIFNIHNLLKIEFFVLLTWKFSLLRNNTEYEIFEENDSSLIEHEIKSMLETYFSNITLENAQELKNMLFNKKINLSTKSKFVAKALIPGKKINIGFELRPYLGYSKIGQIQTELTNIKIEDLKEN